MKVALNLKIERVDNESCLLREFLKKRKRKSKVEMLKGEEQKQESNERESLKSWLTVDICYKRKVRV